MYPLMASEWHAVAEGFPTNTAFVRFLTCVDSVVDSQGRPTVEGLPSTFVRFLSSVNSPVQGQSDVNTEDFPEISAIKRLLPRVVMPKSD